MTDFSNAMTFSPGATGWKNIFLGILSPNAV